MASVTSSTSSLSSTLQGYGGMASGIDRDSIIEQMTSGTQSKITKLEQQKTELGWKQEAYQSLSDKLIDLQDNYMTYSSDFNIKNSSSFAQSIISAIGDSDYTKYISASGTSSLVNYLSILGVKQTASSATLMSKKFYQDSVSTGTSVSLDQQVTYSKLSGTKLVLGHDQYTDGAVSGFSDAFSFEFVSGYVDSDGETHVIDYTDTSKAGLKKLAEDLNTYIKEKNVQFSDNLTSGNGYRTLQFEYDEATDSLIYKVVEKSSTNDEITKADVSSEYQIGVTASTALSALGVSATGTSMEYGDYKTAAANSQFSGTSVGTTTMDDYLKNKKLSITYGGQTKEIELLTSDDIEAMKDMSVDDKNRYMAETVQSRINKAFGSGKMEVSIGTSGELSFKDISGYGQTLKISSDNPELRKILGIKENQSNKLTASASLEENFAFTGDATLTINDVEIKGVTKDTTINELIDLINNNADVGVKATYMEGTGQLLLVAEDTGSGREITVGGNVAEAIFGTAEEIKAETRSMDGQDAIMEVSYGNGANQTIVSSSNTFQLDGLNITVSGTFGYDGAGQLDTSQTVRFEASADVDNVTENVKKFIEEYNALVDALYSESTTKPDSDYGVLTDDQKDEMSESEIEKWEKKAKEGLLYGDSTVRDLYSDIQALSAKILNSGISYDDLESIGITFSDSRADYGKLIFDETTFKEAMKSNSELVSDIFTGGGDVKTGLGQLVEDTLTPYATRYATKNGNSYGKLIEEAGSSKLVLSTTDNYIYEQLKQMEEQIATMKTRLKTEQDRYIQQFTRMESAISTYNTQASYISGLSG